uniref:Uncharacterized protein n=1 Tax=Clytia hemisphaerica TaxID=252671 RepID=A0A7M6DLC8_9CNID
MCLESTLFLHICIDPITTKCVAAQFDNVGNITGCLNKTMDQFCGIDIDATAFGINYKAKVCCCDKDNCNDETFIQSCYNGKHNEERKFTGLTCHQSVLTNEVVKIKSSIMQCSTF